MLYIFKNLYSSLKLEFHPEFILELNFMDLY